MRVVYEELYLNREKEEGELRRKCESGMAKNPPPVDLRAVCYAAGNDSDDKQQAQANIKEITETDLGASHFRVLIASFVKCGHRWCVVRERGEARGREERNS